MPGMRNVAGLRCRECGKDYPAQPTPICEACFGPLEVEYDTDRVREDMTRSTVEAGPPSLWRYAALLPDPGPERRIDLQAGFTPLRRAHRLGPALGLRELYLKDDTMNPTGSFKDRVAAVAISAARLFGLDTVGCASTGNLANATAAAAAAAGLDAFVFIPADLEAAKIVATAALGARVVAVNGNYDRVNRLCTELAESHGWGFVNVNLRPYYAEGSKTLGFETVEQLGWRLPDHVVVPIASGALMTKIHEGMGQLVDLELAEEHPVRVSGAQAEGCSPVAQAFRSGSEEIRPVRPETIAKSLAIGSPADGYYALRTARATGGTIEAVSDSEIVEGIRLLASTEGLFAETAGGVTIGVLKKLREQGAIEQDEVTVAYVTGTGFKTIDALQGLGPTMVVEPSVESFEEALAAAAAS